MVPGVATRTPRRFFSNYVDNFTIFCDLFCYPSDDGWPGRSGSSIQELSVLTNCSCSFLWANLTPGPWMCRRSTAGGYAARTGSTPGLSHRCPLQLLICRVVAKATKKENSADTELDFELAGGKISVVPTVFFIGSARSIVTEAPACGFSIERSRTTVHTNVSIQKSVSLPTAGGYTQDAHELLPKKALQKHEHIFSRDFPHLAGSPACRTKMFLASRRSKARRLN